MSTTIDQRVVQMRFDNQQFESGAKTSLGTLDKLKNALSFNKASKELQDFQNQSSKFHLGSINEAIQTVTTSFSAFEVMGLRVLSNIADSAYRTGARLVKSLSVDNIAAGWSKYEDKTTSVATLVAQGYKMSEVDEQLNRLNWFTDETSYNFTDMVASISKFTASGKGLKESVNAMEGIATWASLSGQNAATASRAMYQLSQAMGAGVMRKEDYKSIQNMSMDTDEFRQKALDAGVALGTLKKNADGTYKSLIKGAGKVESFSKSQFAEHLTKDLWFTDKVMMKVFGDYGAAVDQIYEYSEEHGVTASEAIEALGSSVDKFGLKAFKSAQEAKTWTDVIDSVKDAVSTGWMQTFELIFGNYKEAKKLWTDLANELYDVFAEGGNARNEMLGDWKELGGRTALIEAFWNAWNGVLNVISMVKDAFRQFFPAMDAERLLDITNRVKDLTEKFENLFKIPELGDGPKKGMIDGMLGDDARVVAKKISTVSNRIENFNNTLKGVFAILDIVKMGFSAAAQLVGRFVSSLLRTGDTVLDITGSFGEWAINLRNSIEETDFFGKIVDKVGPIVDKTGTVIIWVLNKIKAAFKAIKGLFKPVNQELTETADIVEEKWSPISGIINFVKKAFDRLGQIFKSLGPVFKQLGAALTTVWDSLHEKIMNGLQNFDVKGGQDLINGGIFGVLLLALTNFVNKIKSILPAIDPEKGIIGTLKDTIGEIISMVKGGEEADVGDSMLKLAGAIGILAGSLFLISTIDTGKLTGSVVAIGALMFMLQKTAKTLSSLSISSSSSSAKGGGIFGKIFGMFSSKTSSVTDLIKTSGALIAIASAVGILAASVFSLSKLKFNELAKGLLGVAALLAMIVAVSSAMSKMDGKLVKGAGSLILVGAAIRVLASSVEKLGAMKVDQMVNGLMAVGALLGALIVFTKFAGDFKMGSGLGLIGLATSFIIIAKAVESFGSMDLNVLSQGLSSAAAVLAGLVIFTQTVNTKGILKTAIAMFVMSESLTVIGKAIKIIGNLNTDQISKGLGAMAGALFLMVAASTAIGSVKGTGGASLSILAMSTALVILAGAFKIMASMPAEQIIKALLGFAGALVALGVAAAILSPLTGGILMLAGSLALIGVAILAASAGLSALSVAIVSLGTSLMIAGPMLVNGIMATLQALLLACNTLIPLFVNVGLNIILNLLMGIYAKLPDIVTMATLVILKFLLTISQLFPLIIMVGIQMIINFINGMALAIRDNSEAIIMAVGNLLSSVVYLVFTAMQKIAEQIPIIGGWVSDGIQGIKDSIDDTFSEEEIASITERGMNGAAEGISRAESSVESASSDLSNVSIEGFMENLPDFSDAMGDFSIEGVNALLGKEGDYKDAGETLSTDAIDGANKNWLYSSLYGVGDYGTTGYIAGLANQAAVAESTAENISRRVVRGARRGLQEKSPSKALFKVGNFGTQGLINGLLSLKDSAEDTAYSIGMKTVDALSSVMNNVAALINEDLDNSINPTITPVLDLSNLQNGTNSINSMFGYTSLALATANGARFEANRLAALNALEMNATNADVVAALGLLRGDVNALNDSFANTQVVLDSGALVGATAKQMDNALGRFNVYKGRGI